MPEPSYKMLASRLRAAILAGEYAEGAQMPTEADLVAELGFSRQTVRRAFQELVSEGLVHRVRGRGTFARQRGGGYVRHVGSIEDLMNLSDDTMMQVVRPLRRRVDLTAAGRLRLATDIVYDLAFVRIHDGDPFCYTHVFLPADSAEAIAAEPILQASASVGSLTIIGLLDAALTSQIAHAEQSITVDRLPAEAVEHLGQPAGTPVLRVDRLYLTSDDQPVELATSYFLPDLYSYRIQLRRTI